MTYSLDLRKQVIRSRTEDGCSYRKTAKFYAISKTTIQTYEADISIQNTRNRTPNKIYDDALKQDVIDYPDAYQYERAHRLNCSH